MVVGHYLARPRQNLSSLAYKAKFLRCLAHSGQLSSSFLQAFRQNQQPFLSGSVWHDFVWPWCSQSNSNLSVLDTRRWGWTVSEGVVLFHRSNYQTWISEIKPYWMTANLQNECQGRIFVFEDTACGVCRNFYPAGKFEIIWTTKLLY